MVSSFALAAIKYALAYLLVYLGTLWLGVEWWKAMVLGFVAVSLVLVITIEALDAVKYMLRELISNRRRF